jgi:hypothetical protein
MSVELWAYCNDGPDDVAATVSRTGAAFVTWTRRDLLEAVDGDVARA